MESLDAMVIVLLYQLNFNTTGTQSSLNPDTYDSLEQDRFESFMASIDVDGSTAVGTVVYTVNIQQPNPTTPAAGTSTTSGISSTTLPLIKLGTSSSPFELHPVNNRQLLVRECLWSRDRPYRSYDITFRFVNYTQCWDRPLSIRHSLTIRLLPAIPIYTGVEHSFVFDLTDKENASVAELFKIKITNEHYFGGCGSFKCDARYLNDNQIFFVDNDNFNVMANRSSITDSFTFTITITCYDSNFDPGNIFYDNQTFTVNVTFSSYKGTVTEGPKTTNVSETWMTTALLSSIITERTESQTTLAIATTPNPAKTTHTALLPNISITRALTIPTTPAITSAKVPAKITNSALTSNTATTRSQTVLATLAITTTPIPAKITHSALPSNTATYRSQSVPKTLAITTPPITAKITPSVLPSNISTTQVIILPTTPVMTSPPVPAKITHSALTSNTATTRSETVSTTPTITTMRIPAKITHSALTSNTTTTLSQSVPTNPAMSTMPIPIKITQSPLTSDTATTRSQTVQTALAITTEHIPAKTSLARPLSTVTDSTTSDRYSHYNFFGDIKNRVAITTTSGIAVIAIAAGVSVIGYKIYKTRMQSSRVIPL